MSPCVSIATDARPGSPVRFPSVRPATAAHTSSRSSGRRRRIPCVERSRRSAPAPHDREPVGRCAAGRAAQAQGRARDRRVRTRSRPCRGRRGAPALRGLGHAVHHRGAGQHQGGAKGQPLDPDPNYGTTTDARNTRFQAESAQYAPPEFGDDLRSELDKAMYASRGARESGPAQAHRGLGVPHDGRLRHGQGHQRADVARVGSGLHPSRPVG
jgi:hypothetical protein